MESWPVAVALPLALGFIMFGLGLSLTVEDFLRVVRYPRAVFVALCCQVIVLPALAFGLVAGLDVTPELAVGVMLLMASPGGATANLLSHLFGGDVALNISLTALNSVLSVATLPLITNIALGYFDPAGTGGVGMQFTKVAQVFALVFVPVVAGMIARRLRPGFADRSDRPVRVLSVLFLVIVTVAALFAERNNIVDYLVDIGAVVVVLCVASLAVGYFVPKTFGVVRAQALACAMEIGVHNCVLAMTIAISVLGDVRMAVPAGVYSIISVPIVYSAGAWLGRGVRDREPRPSGLPGAS